MRFVVTKACTGGGGAAGRARAGALYAGSSQDPIETPALLLASRKGLPSFIPPDLLPSLNSRLLHVSPLYFIENPSVNTISSIGGLHQMVGLHDHVFAATARDSVVCLPQHEGANRIGASFETPTGRRMMKPSAYMELVSSLKPDICGSLADEVPAWVTEKRNRISVDRTLRWLDDCLALEKVLDLSSNCFSGGFTVHSLCPSPLILHLAVEDRIQLKLPRMWEHFFRVQDGAVVIKTWGVAKLQEAETSLSDLALS